MEKIPLDALLQRSLPRARTCWSRPAGCPGIELCLFDPDCLEGPLSHEEAQLVVAEPAYWSFCWASGQVMAQWLLDNPERVAGRRVLDFGCGSGIVAIAAAMAGAREVIAADIDPDALAATDINARRNGVTVTLAGDWRDEARPEVLLAADVLYDPENRPMLWDFQAGADAVLMADSRLRHLGNEDYRLITTVEGRTWPDLNEFEEFNRVRLYWAPGGGLDGAA
ncbi:50S ribosomal protein L11 methyltransferase [Halospina sp. K52047b]|jgi:predicted nicotinamide N-methyase|uniref:class I SAM-dependent methyltransferase n=1 Tax=Halospina sp. K52047b TaxID=2614160 RepID=UPI00124A4E13|nr:50S ribosomal protein L11 methyltransferase [Halospina sp. K52047b]KAA8983453.1 methyltransferase [Halospina sp. K52047b]